MDTLIFTVDEVESWKAPTFQRPIRINDKVRALAEELKTNQGVIPGILTIGRLGADTKTNWIVDGNHRVTAFKISNLREGIADVRIVNFETMGQMAEEFVRLNSQLVRMRPDDVLRGLEANCPGMQIIRKNCEFVGYNQIRRDSTYGPIVSMAAVLRTWTGSGAETPALSHGGSATNMAETLSKLEAEQCVQFLNVAHVAWGHDIENYRLWASLNLCLSMWLFRRLVLDRDPQRHEASRPAQHQPIQAMPHGVERYIELCRLSRRADAERARAPPRLQSDEGHLHGAHCGREPRQGDCETAEPGMVGLVTWEESQMDNYMIWCNRLGAWVRMGKGYTVNIVHARLFTMEEANSEIRGAAENDELIAVAKMPTPILVPRYDPGRPVTPHGSGP